ncbi:uncharacterized protein EI90DRAFT_669289 [Cantharellus anzutake]|uniref:uncharacterized protein n=1 Tax=Cantharellus anzutake TaxID=1750568 RepID=UPI00190432D2|nr:uncharacterized protein EI90DRAFT_669289 [Cantharellus anzutake]KAF8312425.1 hypothetical protein EI90DRAFT_669289 [Cantharellus anzutake]
MYLFFLLFDLGSACSRCQFLYEFVSSRSRHTDLQLASGWATPQFSSSNQYCLLVRSLSLSCFHCRMLILLPRLIILPLNPKYMIISFETDRKNSN